VSTKLPRRSEMSQKIPNYAQLHPGYKVTYAVEASCWSHQPAFNTVLRQI